VHATALHTAAHAPMKSGLQNAEAKMQITVQMELCMTEHITGQIDDAGAVKGVRMAPSSEIPAVAWCA
jgi:hypothetical protein